MEMWEIEGGLPLRGEVRVARAKNAVLPQMAAALLTEEPVRILDAPELTDVGRMAQMLIDLGGTVRSEGGALDIVCASPRAKASGTIEGLTRASVLALGPLLARCGEATLAASSKSVYFIGDSLYFSGSTGEDIQQYAYIGRLCCFVNTDAYLATFEVAKVHFAFQSDFTQCIYRNMSRQFDLQRIEVILVQLSVT